MTMYFFKCLLLFIYLYALGLSCSLCDLVPWPGTWPKPFALRALRLSHWTSQEFDELVFTGSWFYLYPRFYNQEPEEARMPQVLVEKKKKKLAFYNKPLGRAHCGDFMNQERQERDHLCLWGEDAALCLPSACSSASRWGPKAASDNHCSSLLHPSPVSHFSLLHSLLFSPSSKSFL